jgi:hypothetical protein
MAQAEILCSREDHPTGCPETYGDIPDNYELLDRCGDMEYLQSSEANFTVLEIWQTSWWKHVEVEWDTNRRDYYGRTKIKYALTCQNGITYQDEAEWEMKIGKCNYPLVGDHDCEGNAEHPNVFQLMSDSWYDAEQNTIEPRFQFYSFDYIPGGLLLPWLPANMPNEVPLETILEKWDGRYVGYPAYHGAINRLATPVIFINGLGYTYEDWGVEAAGPKGSEAWRQGLVKSYKAGSLPDIMARAYGLSSDFNENGIYFINLDVEEMDGNEIDYGVAILQRVLDIFREYLLTSGGVAPDFQVDFVCHSASCVALNGALDYADGLSFYGFSLNLRDKIRRILSINAPHMGSGLALDRAELEANEAPEEVVQNLYIQERMYEMCMSSWIMGDCSQYEGGGLSQDYELGGLSRLKREIAGDAVNDEVFSGSFELDYSTLGWNQTDGWLAPLAWLGGQMVDIFLDDYTEFDVKLKGGMLGPHSATLKVGGDVLTEFNADGLRPLRSELDKYSRILENFQEENNQYINADYPRNSRNEYVPYQTFYSADVGLLEGELIKYLSRIMISPLCEGSDDIRCTDIQRFAEAQIADTFNSFMAEYGGEDFSGHVGYGMFNTLTRLKAGWLKNSDMIVQKSSQTWNTDRNHWHDNNIKSPLTYSDHYRETRNRPEEHGVLHGPMPLPFQFGTPSLQLGKDLFCGLEPYCADLLKVNANPFYSGPAVQKAVPGLGDTWSTVWANVVDLAGDFDLYPRIINSGSYRGILIEDNGGNFVAQVVYDPENGTYAVTGAGTKGAVASGEIIYSPDYVPQITVQRKNGVLKATLLLRNGKKSEIDLGSYTGAVKLSALSKGEAPQEVAFIGTGTFSEVQSVPPIPEPITRGSILSYAQESGHHENNQLRMRLWVANISNEAVQNLQQAFYFTADPARYPVVEMDYPRNIPFQVEHLGGENYRLLIDVSEVQPRSVFPLREGMQVRIHYQDWSYWTQSDDYSLATFYAWYNERIPVYDSYGRLIWGSEPSPSWSGEEELEQQEPVHLELSVRDGGQWEQNMIRPRATISHISGPNIDAGYRVFAFMDLEGNDLPVLENWYSPDCSGSIQRTRQGRVRLEWNFNRYALQAEQTVNLGEWGLHWSNWTAINKPAFENAQWVILDAQNQVLFGQWPEGEDLPATKEEFAYAQ